MNRSYLPCSGLCSTLWDKNHKSLTIWPLFEYGTTTRNCFCFVTFISCVTRVVGLLSTQKQVGRANGEGQEKYYFLHNRQKTKSCVEWQNKTFWLSKFNFHGGVQIFFLRHMKSRDTRIFYLLVVILEGSFADGHIIVSFSIGPNPVKGGGFSRQFGRKSAF